MRQRKKKLGAVILGDIMLSGGAQARPVGTQPVAAMLGARMRELREYYRKRQDEVAAIAREWGLPWTQATVAAIELGHRHLSLGEFFFLPYVLTFSCAEGVRFIDLTDLLPEQGSVTLTPGIHITSIGLRKVLRGEAGKVLSRDFTMQRLRDIRQLSAQFSAQADATDRNQAILEKVVSHVWPEAKHERTVLEAVLRDAQGAAERKIARTLAVPPVAVALAAHKVWGHGLTAERDRQVSTQVTKKTPLRTLQALRGHISRALLAQIQPLVEGLSQTTSAVEE